MTDPQSRKARLAEIIDYRARPWPDQHAGALAEAVDSLLAELTQAQSQLKQCAELMRTSTNVMENYALHWFDDGACLCSMCGEKGDGQRMPGHKPDCAITRLRTAADQAEGK